MIRAPFRHRLGAPFRRFARCEAGGGGVIEFVIMLPVVMFLFMASAEAGLYTARQILLDHAVAATMRDLGLGNIPNPSHDVIKTNICENVPAIPRCEENIRVELVPVSTTMWNLPTTDATCIDRGAEVQPALSFNPGAANDLMLVRVCVIQDAMFPGASIGRGLEEADGQEGYRIISVSGFVNEPT
ncbi:MAG: TadE/TadG family type IV pilus assembly protein [Gemmobacter sp.]